MAVRETLNKHPVATLATTLGLIVAAGVQLYQSTRQPEEFVAPTSAWYTIDDGKSWFADDVLKVPPFNHAGGQAVRAHVFACSDGKPFVGYLERINPSARDKVAKSR